MSKKIFFIFFFTSLFFLISISQINAVNQITITSHPSFVQKLEEFDVNFSVSLESNQEYYVKARIGEPDGLLNKGETYNETTSTWFSDTSPWTNFPTIITDSNGNSDSSVRARAKDAAQEGTNKLTIRARKVGDTNNIDSNLVDIQISSSPSPTPSPTSTPTSSPTPTPSPSPTPTLVPTPTSSPSHSPTPTPTTTPSPTPLPTPTVTPLPMPTPTSSPTLTPTPSPTITPSPSPPDFETIRQFLQQKRLELKLFFEEQRQKLNEFRQSLREYFSQLRPKI